MHRSTTEFVLLTLQVTYVILKLLPIDIGWNINAVQDIPFSLNYCCYALIITIGKDWSKILPEVSQQSSLLKVEILLLNFPF